MVHRESRLVSEQKDFSPIYLLIYWWLFSFMVSFRAKVLDLWVMTLEGIEYQISCIADIYDS